MTQAESRQTAVRDEMRAFIREVAIYLPADHELRDEDDLMALGAIDSLGFVELVEEVQARYAITVGDVDITEENFGSIAAIVRYVEAKQPK